MEPHIRFAAAALPLACVFAFTTLPGCARDEKPQRLSPAVFAPGPSGRTVKPADTDPLSAADQPGALYAPTPEEGAAQTSDPLTGVSRTVQENVRPPGARSEDLEPPTTAGAAAPTASSQAGSAPAPRQASTRPTTAPGGYLTVGGVVAEVNGTPIYANKVINLIEPVLAARAKELDETKFRAMALQEIKQQMLALRNLELEYAAAERNLDQKDKDLADLMTTNWRQRQITAAGGSAEVARQRAAARGDDFEELVQQQYRVFMSRIYYEKKVMPRVQVSADEMRAFYDRHRDTDFIERGVAQFRVIRIDVKKAGGREAAIQKATALRDRVARAGEQFETLARTVNDNPLLLKTGGAVKVDQGSFAVKEVDDAVWQTPEGELTPVIDAGDAVYLAQVQEKKPGKTLAFEDEEVQTRISERLRSEQFRELRQRVQDNLVKDATVRSEPEWMNIAIEMAMQNYPRWAEK